MVEPLKDLGSSDFFFLIVSVKLKSSWESPRLQPKRKNLMSPGNYPDHKVKTGNRANSI